MQNILRELTPNSVFKFFEEIAQIPRCSGDEQRISDYLVNFAKERKLEVTRDKALNVIIKKPAAPGYENAPTVILQGHMDMVCEKNKETIHDFEKDPIKLRIVDDLIFATETTLGADNGIALAYALALLEADDILHPAIEALFTTDEESTMGGAIALDGNNLKGRLLINLDSEEEGKLLVSSAGGTKAKVVLPIAWESARSGMHTVRIRIGGLKGGHSGMEINKQRGNANKLMGRLLNDIKGEMEIFLNEINGGVKSNAIPREVDVVAQISRENLSKLEAKMQLWELVFKNELRAADPEICVKLEIEEQSLDRVFNKESLNMLTACLMLLPNGIQSMSMEIEGLVESSTNLGVVQTAGDNIYLINEIRSSVKTLKRSTLNTIKMLAETLGGELRIESDYPEWEYNPNSEMRKLFQKVYKDMYNKEAEIIAIHAGLECGVLAQKLDGLDSISLGPNIFDVHTPKENFSIASTKNVWEYLLEVLKQMNTI
ncbi:MAG: aminoacyl-histidine dipeptidase [Clostridiales bacterium GWB2_37_7]|nr:MAG: aminoacyl-histidine dipeptidase [Clostridiales bacterium GWB2_37_7]